MFSLPVSPVFTKNKYTLWVPNDTVAPVLGVKQVWQDPFKGEVGMREGTVHYFEAGESAIIKIHNSTNTVNVWSDDRLKALVSSVY